MRVSGARAVTSTAHWEGPEGYEWETPDTIIVFLLDTYRKPYLARYRISSGAYEALSALNRRLDDFGDEAVRANAQMWSALATPAVSPDGKWITWVTRYAQSPPGDWIVASIDGSRWASPVYGLFAPTDFVWSRDSRTLMALRLAHPPGRSQVIRFGVGPMASLSRNDLDLVPKSWNQGMTSLGLTRRGRLLVANWDPQKVTRTIDLCEAALQPGGAPPRRWSLRLPASGAVESIRLSPDGSLLALDVTVGRRADPWTPGGDRPDAMWPWTGRNARIWVCNADGSQLRLVGDLAVTWATLPWNRDDRDTLRMRWRPGRRELSFVVGDTFYLAPIPTAPPERGGLGR